MPRFYFHMYADYQPLADENGSELPDHKAAQQEAVKAVSEAVRSAPIDGARHTFAVQVQDEGRREVFETSVSITSRSFECTAADQRVIFG
jgi:hypothetical protein